MRSLLIAPGIFLAATSVDCPAAEPRPFALGAVVVLAENDRPAVDSIADHLDISMIRKFERNDLAEALRLSPGVTVSNTGPRNEAGVNVRGFDLRQVPVFIDGIPVYVPYDGYVDLRRFTTADVAEISVSKGFSSALHGANTLGGAINVLTRQPERPIEGDFRLGFFEVNGFESALNVGGRQGKWYWQLGGSFLDVDSYRMSDDFRPVPRENGGQRDNAYREDWRISAKIGFTPNDTDEYALGYIRQRGEKGNPLYTGRDPLNTVRFWQWPRWDKQTVYLVTNTHLGERGYLKSRFFWDQFVNTLFSYDNARYNSQLLGRAFQSYYDDWTLGGSLEGGVELSEQNTLKAAVHGKFDHHREHNERAPFYTFEDTTWSFGLEDTHELTDVVRVVAGVSYDRREVLEAVDTNTGAPLGGDTFDAFNPQLGLFYDLPGEAGTLHATVARKSRFPTIKDRYSYRMNQAIPNPNLQPESAVHYEVGYEGKVRPDLTMRAALFAAQVEDTIQRVDNVAQNPTRWQFQNVGRSRNLGLEAGFDYQPCQEFQLGMNYAYLDRKNESQPLVKLIDTPRHSFLGYADVRPVSWLSIIPSLEYNGSRWSTTYGIESGAWAVTNLKLSFRLPRQVTLNVGVNNLLDRNYALTEGFPEAGRTFFMNMLYEF